MRIEMKKWEIERVKEIISTEIEKARVEGGRYILNYLLKNATSPALRKELLQISQELYGTLSPKE